MLSYLTVWEFLVPFQGELKNNYSFQVTFFFISDFQFKRLAYLNYF
jgi:hypothetical protein